MEKITFKDYNLTIKLTPFINIIGSSGSGKTYLLKQLINRVNNESVYLDDNEINSYELQYLRENIAAVLNDFKFKTEYVKEELLYYQQKINIEDSIAYRNIERFTKFFGLEDIIDVKIDALTTYEKAYIRILSLLIIKPSILGIDDLLTYLKIDDKLKIIKYSSSNNISILNVTTNSEELLFGTDIIVLDNQKVIAYDTSENIISTDKYFNKVGMNPPFIVEMSTNLNYYDLLKKEYFDMKALVGELWK